MEPLKGSIIKTESRLFQLDFAYIDCVCSVWFCYLVAARSRSRQQAGRPHAWLVHRACHYFGAFAFFADYILYYHVQGTRTVKYPGGDTPMTSWGTFCFFFWFDWINGAVIVMWAMLVCEDLLFDRKPVEEVALRDPKFGYADNQTAEAAKEIGQQKLDSADASADACVSSSALVPEVPAAEAPATESAADATAEQGTESAAAAPPDATADAAQQADEAAGAATLEKVQLGEQPAKTPESTNTQTTWDEKRDRAPLWMFIVVPLWFWATPPLSSFDALPLDNRLLMVERPSEKDKYWMLMVLFAVVMRCHIGMRITEMIRVLFSGIGCGMIHHAPLFFFGMRGYSDPAALAVTLCTEWPAIIMGLFVITRLFCGGLDIKTKVKGQRMGLAIFAVVMAMGCAGPAGFSMQSIIYGVMPYVPAQPYQKLGQIYCWTTTCAMPKVFASLPCDAGPGSDLWVAAAAQKSAAVMTAMIALEVANACGKCVGVGDRPNGAWPNPIETPPPYASEMLLAMANMPSWPKYVEQLGAPIMAKGDGERRSRCIVTVRDPVARLVSTFDYAKAGRETWFREHGIDKKLNHLIQYNNSTKQENVKYAVEFMLERFGMAYLEESHKYLMMNIELGCTVIKYEDLKADFKGTMSRWLDAWGISQDTAVRAQLLELTSFHSPSAQTADNHHATSYLSSPSMKANVEEALLANSTLAAMVQSQRAMLGYESPSMLTQMLDTLWGR